MFVSRVVGKVLKGFIACASEAFSTLFELLQIIFERKVGDTVGSESLLHDESGHFFFFSELSTFVIAFRTTAFVCSILESF